MSNNRHALIIGAGVTGLTSALCLSRRGIRSTILAERLAPGITSSVAGALWEWPPAVCGAHHDPVSLQRSKRWSAVSYETFEKLAETSGTGVYLRPVNFYFRAKLQEHPFHLAKTRELRQQVKGFHHDAGLIQANGINEELGLKDAYRYVAPMVDMDVYLTWLLSEVRSAGSAVVLRRVEGALRSEARGLKREFHADTVINCAGLGAQELADDPMYPVRGAMVRLVNDGARIPRITQAHCLSPDGVTKDDEIAIVLPRGEDRIVLGALAEPDEYAAGIDLRNYAPLRRMYERCLEFLPLLRGAEIDPKEPVRVGFRPFRKSNIRLEHDAETGIIHNYGHGGAGVTFSWGCAMEVADLTARLLDAAAGRAASGANVLHGIRANA